MHLIPLSLLWISISFSGPAPADPAPSAAAVREVVERFEAATEARSVEAIEKLVTADLVVIENGGRNDGWADFRDRHLIPEFKEPGLPWKHELLTARAAETMGWAYTRATARATRPRGEVEYTLYSTYVLEKRGAEWRIASLNWSISSRVVAPAATPKP